MTSKSAIEHSRVMEYLLTSLLRAAVSDIECDVAKDW